MRSGSATSSIESNAMRGRADYREGIAGVTGRDDVLSVGNDEWIAVHVPVRRSHEPVEMIDLIVDRGFAGRAISVRPDLQNPIHLRRPGPGISHYQISTYIPMRALRFELRTSTLSGWRSNQLSYARF